MHTLHLGWRTQGREGGALVVEGAGVVMLPYHPSAEMDDGCEALA